LQLILQTSQYADCIDTLCIDVRKLTSKQYKIY
jgi:hypothetical protein